MSKKKPIRVPLYKHGIIWWILIGWWWRPAVFLFWMFFNILFNCRIEFVKER